MLVDKYINRMLERIWPVDAQGESKVHFHSQNLNEDETGKAKGWPVHGRCWLYVKPRRTARLEWVLWSKNLGFSIKTDSEDGGLSLHASLPPVSLYLTLPIPVRKYLQGDFWKRWNESTGGFPDSHKYSSFILADIRFHDQALFWEFLKFDWGWSNRMPKWMNGAFHVTDFVLGRQRCDTKVVSVHEAGIPMPEGNYPATIKLERITWKRPRWFPMTKRYASVDLKIGIPHQGKGENSWDCGEDALHGMSCEASTVEDAIAATVKSALRSRRCYDGDIAAKYPDPSTRKPRVRGSQSEPSNDAEGGSVL